MSYKVNLIVPPNAQPGETFQIKYEVIVSEKLKLIKPLVLKVDSKSAYRNRIKTRLPHINDLFLTVLVGSIAYLRNYIKSIKRVSTNLITLPIELDRDEKGVVLPGAYCGEVTVTIPQDTSPSHSYNQFFWRFYQEVTATIVCKRKGLPNLTTEEKIQVVSAADPKLSGHFLHRSVRPRKYTTLRCKVDCEFKQFSVLTHESVQAKLIVTNNDDRNIKLKNAYLTETKYSKFRDYYRKTSEMVKFSDPVIAPGQTREFDINIPIPQSFSAFYQSVQFQNRHFVSFYVSKGGIHKSYEVPFFVTNDERGMVFKSEGSTTAKRIFSECIVYPSENKFEDLCYWQSYRRLSDRIEESGITESKVEDLDAPPAYPMNKE